MRWLRHLFTTRWQMRRAYATNTLDAIEAAVAASEQVHRGELRFALEAAFDLPQLLRTLTPRQRAVQVFTELGVWDTDENNGVLVFVLLAENAVEIVADRGYAGLVTTEEWQAACMLMAARFANEDFAGGARLGIEALTTLMARAFPGNGRDPDELPNRPHLM